MREGFFDKRIYFRYSQLDTQKPTLLFIHGLTGSVSSWQRYEDAFQRDYNIINFDLRGHGKSVKINQANYYSLDAMAEDVYELLRHLDIKNIILVSHSFGTLVGLRFLRLYPKAAKAAVFLSPNYKLSQQKFWGASRFAANIFSELLQRLPLLKKTGKHIDYREYPNAGDWNLALNAADLRNTSLRVYFYCLRQLRHAKLDQDWQKIAVPCLIVHGRNDTIVSCKAVIEMSGAMNRGALQILERANHLFVLNNPEAVANILHNFFQTL